jgi:hypothetical protein
MTTEDRRQMVTTGGLQTLWRKRWDSNPRYAFTHGGFQDRYLKPLGHPSALKKLVFLKESL